MMTNVNQVFALAADELISKHANDMNALRKAIESRNDRRIIRSIDAVALSPCRVINLMNKAAAGAAGYSEDEVAAAREALELVGFPKLKLTDCLLSSDGKVSVVRGGETVPAPVGFRGVLASIKAKKSVEARAAKVAARESAKADREAAKVAKAAARATVKLVAALVAAGYTQREAALIASKKA